jgi:iron complex outermembrane receptor protein
MDGWRFLELKYKTKFSYNTEFMARSYFCNYIYYGTFPYDSEEYTTLWEEESDGRWLGFESQFNWDIGPANRLVTGVEYKNHIRTFYKAWDDYETIFDNNFPFTEFSCYAQDEHQLLESLSIILGVRYDRYSDRGKFFSPRAALVYNPSGRTTLKLLYGRAFRAPNIYELYYESPDEAKSNPFLNEEKINTFETVIEQKLSDSISGVLSLYRYEMRDLIEQKFDFTDELLQFQNIEKVSGNGIEVGLNAYFKNGFLFYLNGAVQEAKNVLLEEKISNSPTYIFKTGLSVPTLKYFFISLEAFYESRRLTLHGSWTKPFLLANFHLCSRTISDFCKFSLQIKNLFDVEYSTPAGFEHFQYVLTQNGRTFTLQLDLILK